MKIYIGCDHNGVTLKDGLIKRLTELGFDITSSLIPNDPLDDYPDFAFDVCKNVVKENGLGILICGSGTGISIAANKVKGIRAAKCYTVEDSSLAREHNNANVLCFGSSIIFDDALRMVLKFIQTIPSEEERHVRRVNKIISYENGAYNEL